MKIFIQMKHDERGQSMVELALTITLLMTLLAGTVDLGRAFFTWLAMRDAAQEGASYGSINPTRLDLVESRVRDNLEQVISNPADLIVTPRLLPPMGQSYPPPGQPCFGNTIQVIVNYPHFPLTTPFLGAVLGKQDLSIHATINDTILAPVCH